MKKLISNMVLILVRIMLLSLPFKLRNLILLSIFKKMIKPFKANTSFDKKEDNINILVLNGERFPQDLKALTETNKVNFYLLPISFQTRFNSIFLASTESFTVHYYLEKSKKVESLVSTLNNVLESLKSEIDIDSVLTCAFYYRQDFPYQESCKRIGLSYNVLFREYMKDQVIIDKTIKRYRENRFKFYGANLFLANENLKKVTLESKVCSEENVKVIGSPRFDTIYRKSGKSKEIRKRNYVTLFSFIHAAGGVELSNNTGATQYPFTSDPEEGFFYLFQDVHKCFAELAMCHPEFNFVIKAKYGGYWLEIITDTINTKCVKKVEEIPNLKLLFEGDSQELIRKSKCVIAFNSTTVLETLLERTPLIIPLFNEADNKYKDTNVYFQNSISSLPIVKSADELKSKLEDYLKNKEYDLECPEQMIKDFLYKFDGRSSERMIEEIKLNNHE